MSKKIAFCSVVTAMGTVFLYFASVLGTAKITCLALAAMMLILPTIKYGVRSSILCFAATSLLGIFLPDKMILAAYAAFFGSYTIIKSLIEKLRSVYAEWIIKLLWFFIIDAAFMRVVTLNINIPGIYAIIGAMLLSVVYDIAVSFVATYILGKLGKYLK